MKRVFFLFLIISSFLIANDKNLVEKSEISIFVNNLDKTAKKVDLISKKYHFITKKYEKDLRLNKLSAEYLLSKENFESALEEINQLGKVHQYKRFVESNIDLIEELDYDINYLNRTKLEMKTEKKLASYEIKNINNDIYDKEKQKRKLSKEIEYYKINLYISERKPYEYYENKSGKISFISMPGLEFKHLKIENPTDGKSSSSYSGYGVKYLFTQGKAYLNFGSLKSNDSIDSVLDKGRIKDIFYYAIGNDFFPRYMGGGKNKFFNLYSGYQFGGVLAVSENDTKHNFSFEPHIGLEIFKNNYMLLDTYFGYFLPIEKNLNYELRGYSLGISFNFAF